MRKTPIFPLAKLVPLGLLATVAAISASYVFSTEELAKAWAGIGLLPLLTYLGYCSFRARKMLLAEQGREREIIELGFVALVADRAARLWAFLFATVAITTCVITLLIWAYQGWLWHRDGAWVSVTWTSIVGIIPRVDFRYLQQFLYWLGDTNFGVVVLIAGLLLAAPLVAVHRWASDKAKLRQKDVANLKKRS